MQKRNKILFIVGTLLMITSIIFGIMYESGLLFILFLVGVYMSNYAGSQEHIKEWNHGICAGNGKAWNFIEVVEYTETTDYLFRSGTHTLLIPPFNIKREEYKGKNRF